MASEWIVWGVVSAACLAFAAFIIVVTPMVVSIVRNWRA